MDDSTNPRSGPGSEPLGAMILQPLPQSASLARRWFHKLIAPYGPACSIDDCTLMISELVTNAVLYGWSYEEWVVRVEWFKEGTSLRVEVHNPGTPVNVRVQQPDADDAHGRGLLLVDSMPSPGTPVPAASAGRSSPSWWPTPGRPVGEPLLSLPQWKCG